MAKNSPSQWAANAAARHAHSGRRSGKGTTPAAPAPVVPPGGAPAPVVPGVVLPEIAGPKANKAAGDIGVTASAGTLMPYMSKTDAQVQSNLLGIAMPKTQEPDFVPNTLTPGTVRNTYMSSDRAAQALTALANMNKAKGSPNWGPGYAFLTNALGLLKQYGGNQQNGMSRENYNAFNQAFTDLMNQTKLDKSVDDYARILPYINLAQAFLTPNMGGKTTEQLMNQSKVAGQTFPGQAAPQLFT